MNLKEAAKQFIKTCQDNEGVEIAFDANEVVVYWENLRFNIKPGDLDKTVGVISEIKSLGGRFE